MLKTKKVEQVEQVENGQVKVDHADQFGGTGRSGRGEGRSG